MLKLLLDQIADPTTRDNFRVLEEAFTQDPLLSGGFQVRQYTFPAAGTFRVRHSLGFLPQDVLVTRKTGAGAFTINYDKIDRDFLDFTTTGPCVVRLLIGNAGG